MALAFAWAGSSAAEEFPCLETPAGATVGSLASRDPRLRAPSASGRYAFTNVNVLPMDAERVLAGHTVLVEGGLIAGLGPSRSLRLPPDTTVIDGSGRWLMPGLVDAHTHERALADWPDDVAGNLAMSLANGITTIFNMGDLTGGMIPVRESVRRGELAGPTVYVGHFARGRSDGGSQSTIVNGAQDARDLVRRARDQGYDFIKVYDGVPGPAYDALVLEGSAAGLPVTGHAVRQLGLAYTLAHGQVMVAHASSFLEMAPSASPSAVAQAAAASGSTVTATLYVYELIAAFGLDGLAGTDAWGRVITQEGVEYMDDRALEAWLRMFRFRSDIRTPRDLRPQLALQQQIVKAFVEAGVPVLLGADTIGIPGVVPGFAIHGEIRLLHAAGLTPWQTLATGTRNPGEFARRYLRSADRFGVVEEGARADLLLLDASPLDDLSVLRSPAGVMAAGRWYPRETLTAQLDLLRGTR